MRSRGHNLGHHRIWFLSLVLTSSLGACDKNDEGKSQPVAEDFQLLEPEERSKADLPKRCRSLEAGQPLTLRARSEKGEPGAVEIGGATAVTRGFVVGALRAASESRAFVAWTDGSGQQSTVDLSQVHGSVEAPQVAALGADVLVAVPDNDAGHTRLRVAKVASLSSKPEVTWGPEVRAIRGETAHFSLSAGASATDGQPSHALLAWDDFEKSSLRSRVLVLPFSPANMKEQALGEVVSAVDADVVWPQVVARPGGYWLTWLSYREMGEKAKGDQDSLLVDEPPRVLQVLGLDEKGRIESEAIDITPAETHVLAYEVAARGRDQLVVASRLAKGGSPTDAIDLKIVSRDGSVSAASVTHSDLGPGAPLVLTAAGGSSSAWLFARGQDQEVLFGPLDGAGHAPGFLEEALLEGKIPLSRSGPDLLTMEPSGLDLRLSVYRCPE